MTFSLLVRDPSDGRIGVASATAGPAVGAFVPRAEARVGAVATQGFSTNPFWTREGLAALAEGGAPESVAARLSAADPGRRRRQLAILSADGRGAAWSGDDNDPWRGHRIATDRVVAGNRLAGPEALDALEAGFEAATGPLARRLLAGLRAAHAAGGDAHGLGSAAIVVVCAEAPPLDIRADLGPDPLAALERTLDAIDAPGHQAFLARVPRLSDRGRC